MDFLTYWRQTKEIVDKLIEDYLSDIKDWELLEVSKYILKDGKRFRATLTMFFTEALGGEQSNSYKAALASEILHSSSLALDDIVDYDLTRRGVKAAWAVYSNRKVIFITNFLIPSALNIISSYGEKALKLSIDLWRDTAIGALKDIFGTPLDYMKTIEYKTASLFKLSSMLSAFAAKREDIVDVMLEIGKDLGIAYQLIDDYIDVYKYERGELKELVGSAKQLYDLKGGEYKEYIKIEYENAISNYISLLRKIDIRDEFRQAVITIPDFLTAGLLNEAGINKL
ncbi:hexaprenyl pyrophosphate synthase [Stygiolobus caldivivus]|uniref:Geranylgeranyl pyrophosphate synthase n=1 Tax=Stygiolobus caldivivus TaxID=2824673 RepID=A0A8D5U499_9CREN|nr:hexaprenyl pyrophosphate synthase [Stygiolobus caldivivus]BCU68982.1 geranylgeranyl pyrophosphate synthase [Stygiolobus caldivivus]